MKRQIFISLISIKDTFTLKRYTLLDDIVEAYNQNLKDNEELYKVIVHRVTEKEYDDLIDDKNFKFIIRLFDNNTVDIVSLKQYESIVSYQGIQFNREVLTIEVYKNELLRLLI